MWYKVHDYTPANKNDYPNWDFGGTDIVKLLHFPPEIQKYVDVLRFFKNRVTSNY